MRRTRKFDQSDLMKLQTPSSAGVRRSLAIAAIAPAFRGGAGIDGVGYDRIGLINIESATKPRSPVSGTTSTRCQRLRDLRSIPEIFARWIPMSRRCQKVSTVSRLEHGGSLHLVPGKYTTFRIRRSALFSRTPVEFAN